VGAASPTPNKIVAFLVSARGKAHACVTICEREHLE